jgi:hypothetical protein
MNMLFFCGTVIAIAFLQVSGAAPQTLDAKTEHDAYAIYATLVYVRVRTSHFSDAVVMMELKEGKWVRAPQSCVGVA